jgi:hypothetical protein
MQQLQEENHVRFPPVHLKLDIKMERFNVSSLRKTIHQSRQLFNHSSQGTLCPHCPSKINSPTSIEPLRELIQEIAAEIKDSSPPSARTVARWILQYRLSSNSALSLSEQGKGTRH